MTFSVHVRWSMLGWFPVTSFLIAGLLASACTSSAPIAATPTPNGAAPLTASGSETSKIATTVVSTPTFAAIPTATNATTQTNGVVVEVYHNGARIATLSVPEVQALPAVTVNVGEVNTGPTLRSALAAKGIPTFQKITAFGTFRGRIAEGEISLKDTDVTDQVILAINQRGEVKLVTPSVPFQQWIVSVKRLTVE